jgi:hypothetical protein
MDGKRDPSKSLLEKDKHYLILRYSLAECRGATFSEVLEIFNYAICEQLIVTSCYAQFYC